MRTFLKIAFASVALAALFSFTNKFTEDTSKTVLLVPYQPVMHLSDADADIAKHSGINIRQVRVVLRNALTERLSLRLRENVYVRHLTEAGTAREKNDLNNFYGSQSFYLSSRDTSKKLFAGDVAKQEHPYFGIFQSNSQPAYESSYMNVSLGKPVLFGELAASYEADYFLVLTQLEIKTHYDECIDIASRIYRREFLLHYAIFDAEGNHKGGNAVSCGGGSDMNTVNKITYEIFPELVTKVCGHVSAATR